MKALHSPSDARSALALPLMCLALLFALRVLLMFLHASDLAELSGQELLRILVVGARLDSAALAYFFLPSVLLLLLPGAIRGRVLALHRWTVLGLVSLVVLGEAGFFHYYGFRANYLLLEHGLDAEVMRSVVASELRLSTLALLGAIGWVGWAMTRAFARGLERILPPLDTLIARSIAAAALLVLLSLAARGTLDHRPINPTLAAISSNRVANELAGSGIYNVGYEGVHWHERSGQRLGKLHELLPDSVSRRRVERLLAPGGSFTGDSSNPFARLVASPAAAGRPLNVVVVVMESFTARLVGSLGGALALSPEFDALSKQGLLLARCYATGERTVQGLEAVLSSFPPLPGDSVVRRPEAQTGFTTLATVLSERGYDTLFLYGGQGIFDHMRGFFLGNGYKSFIEESDFESPSFHGTWGVSDEDVFRRANLEFQRRWTDGTPFFATILTVSLHTPWEFPRGRAATLAEDVVVPEGFERAELENFLYADYAVGEFMRQARRLPYASDTVFVFVGDHGVHLRGRELLPSEEYRVPALFISPDRVTPQRVETVTSQLDIAPTVMGIVGGPYRSPFFGRDVLREPDSDSLAILVYSKRHYGARRGNRLSVIQSHGDQAFYTLGADGAARPEAATDAHREDAADTLSVLQAAEGLLLSGSFSALPAVPGKAVDPELALGSRP